MHFELEMMGRWTSRKTGLMLPNSVRLIMGKLRRGDSMTFATVLGNIDVPPKIGVENQDFEQSQIF
jgi:hypothetical protein